MIELEVILDFACCTCQEAVSVTVKCEGKGLASSSRTVAAVNVPCPTCGAVNRLCFEPNGTIRGVSLYPGFRPVPEPSIN
jgi:hypothetical protein